MAAHYQVTAYQPRYGTWYISYFKFEPESGMIQQVFYHGEASLIIDDKTSPVELLTKSTRITGAMKAVPDNGPQSLTLKGQWTPPQATGYKQMLEQIHIRVHDDPFLNQVERQLMNQLTEIQKTQNRKRESELLEEIQALRAQINADKIIIRNFRVMPGVCTADREVEISRDQDGRINLIVQRNGANVDYVCWSMTPEQVPFPTDEVIIIAMNEGFNDPGLRPLLEKLSKKP